LREKEKAMALLQRELSLTPVQTERVGAILDDYRRYYGNIQDQVEEVRATGKSRILEVLDPQQRVKFQKLAEGLK
jgi:Spy/CpxP family protein refolding chaperone